MNLRLLFELSHLSRTNSLQLCVDVQIPEFLGGAGGNAVFIDTACNYSPQRVRGTYQYK